MTVAQSVLAAGPPLLFLLLGLVPAVWSNRGLQSFRAASAGAAVLSLLMAIGSAVMLAIAGPADIVWLARSQTIPFSLGLYMDSLSVVMTLLISFIGFIIVRFSIRYLDREAEQGRFLKWMALTLGGILLFVASRNLVMLTAAWILASFGLHRLLTFYRDRSWAIWASRKKFMISRLGDIFLLAGLGLTYYTFGSVEYADLFSQSVALQQDQLLAAGTAAAMTAAETPTSPWVAAIGTLFVLGAMTKSAQIPFHSWLPDTMETPTPVSALMHAGIINAGGFLVLRLSPLISSSHLAMDFLAAIGALTALAGSVVMLTQSSVKRQLAWSTIAQMGFMMLQCGLGAFSAALLHIVAHSLYKAHAFLTSGSVLDVAAGLQQGNRPQHRSVWMLPVAIVLSGLICLGAAAVTSMNQQSTSGSLVLGLVLGIALTQLIWPSLSSRSWPTAVRGTGSAAVVGVVYFLLYRVTDLVLSTSVSHHMVAPSLFDNAIVALAGFGFLAVFGLQALMDGNSKGSSQALRAFYVHALNGFYLDVPARRITGKLWGQRGPVQ